MGRVRPDAGPRRWGAPDATRPRARRHARRRARLAQLVTREQGRSRRSTSEPAAGCRRCTCRPTRRRRRDRLNPRCLELAALTAELNDVDARPAARAASTSRSRDEVFDLSCRIRRSSSPPARASGWSIATRGCRVTRWCAGSSSTERPTARAGRVAAGPGELGAPRRCAPGWSGSRHGSARRVATPGWSSASSSTSPGTSRCGSTTPACVVRPTTSHATTPGSAWFDGAAGRGRRVRLAVAAQRRPAGAPMSGSRTGRTRSSSRSGPHVAGWARPGRRARRASTTPPCSTRTLVREPDVVEERVGTPGRRRSRPRSCCAPQRGMRRARAGHDRRGARLVGACDGDLTVAQIAGAASCSLTIVGRAECIIDARGCWMFLGSAETLVFRTDSASLAYP